MDYLIDLFLHLDVHLAEFVAHTACGFTPCCLPSSSSKPGWSSGRSYRRLVALRRGRAGGHRWTRHHGGRGPAGRGGHRRGRGQLFDRALCRPASVLRARLPGFLHKVLNRDHLDKAHAFFEKHGGMAVVSGRFVPIVLHVRAVRGGAAACDAFDVRLLQHHRRGDLGDRLRRCRLPLRQRPDHQGQLLAGGHRHRVRVGDPIAIEIIKARRTA